MFIQSRNLELNICIYSIWQTLVSIEIPVQVYHDIILCIPIIRYWLIFNGNNTLKEIVFIPFQKKKVDDDLCIYLNSDNHVLEINVLQ